MADRSDADKGDESVEATQQRQRAIGGEIRRMYQGVVNEPVPDHLLDLLRQLDAKGEKDDRD